MNIQFKKGALELCVLAIVHEQDCYGYELTEKISRHIGISEGSIYTLLRRLTKEEYFTTYLVESSEGPSRKYYKLTERGKLYLDEMKSQWEEFSNGVNELLAGQNVVTIAELVDVDEVLLKLEEENQNDEV